VKARPILPPSLCIVLSIEAAPRVLTDAHTDAEASRLCDWICSQDDLVELLDRALLAAEARRGGTSA
jgi:hypothetical protein